MKSSIRLIILVSLVSTWLILLPASRPPLTQAGANLLLTPAQTLGIAQGAYIRPVVTYGNELNLFNTLVGKKLAIDMYFTDWSTASSNGQPFDPFLLNSIRTLPAADWPVIMYTWMPQNGRLALGCDHDYAGGIPPTDITAGRCDDYIIAMAQGLKSRPERFILRFAHEMNIPDSTYWPGHFGQDATTFVAMWRHVYNLFEAEGVNNVEWLWAPTFATFPALDWNNIHNYYPGDAYVDWVGPDGYNWYTGIAPAWPWRSFTWLFDSVLKDFACRYPKPQLIHEISSVEGTGTQTKANWISDAFQQMPNYPFLRGFIWFNDYAFGNPGLADLRITSNTAVDNQVAAIPTGSGAWTNAYKAGLASPVYTSTLPTLSKATPPTIYCGSGETQLAVSPNVILMSPGETAVAQLTGMLYNSALTLSVDWPSTFSGSTTPTQLAAPWGSAQINVTTSPATSLGQYTVTVHAGAYTTTITVIVVDTVWHSYLPLAAR